MLLRVTVAPEVDCSLYTASGFQCSPASPPTVAAASKEWACGLMDSWAHGFMGLWIQVFIGLWVSGSVGSWAHKLMDS